MDRRQAVQVFKACADQNDPVGQFLYGVHLYHGKFVPIDVEEGMKCFKLSGESGVASGQFCYGMALIENKPESFTSEALQILHSSSRNGSYEAGNLLGLFHFADHSNFDFEPFLESVKHNFCAKYNYASYLLDTGENLSEAIELLKSVANQDQDESLFHYKVFLTKENGADTPTRWKFLQGECDAGYPEAMFILGKHEYTVCHRPKSALEYFERAASMGHAEAQYACGTLLFNEFGHPLSSVEDFYRDASSGGVLFAQYEYGILLSKMESRHSRELGGRYLQMAAKEVLLRRQCKPARIESHDGRRRISNFFYNSIPDDLTDIATDKYIWEHLNENLTKLDRYTWKEILEGPKTVLIKGLKSRRTTG